MIYTSIKKLRYVCAVSHSLKKLSIKKKKKLSSYSPTSTQVFEYTNLQIQL